MIASDILTQSRVFARLSQSGLGDTQAYSIIDQAHREVVMDIDGIPKRATVTIGEQFFLGPELYFNLTIVGGANALVATDVQVTSTVLNAATGTAVATSIQTAINAAIGAGTVTVTWSTSFFFTIVALGATSITITLATGVPHGNATFILFGTANATQTGTTWTGQFPRDCTVEAALPSDFQSMTAVTWNNIPISPAPEKPFFTDPKIAGSFPYYYFIRGDKLQLFPTPNHQYICNIWYTSVPATNTLSSSSMTPVLPDRYQLMLVYYVTRMFLMATHEYDKATYWYGLYLKQKNKYIVNKANQITEPTAVPPVVFPYIVKQNP